MALDDAWVSSLVGKTVFVQRDVFEHDDERREHPEHADYHGRIVRVNKQGDVVIQVVGESSEHCVPLDKFPEFYKEGAAGEYVIRQSGEKVVNPDYIAKVWATKSDPDSLKFEGFSQH